MKKFIDRSFGYDVYLIGSAFVIYSGCFKNKFSTLEAAQAWASANSRLGYNFINQ